MKKFFILMGTWLFAILAVFAGSAIYGHFKTSEYDAAAKPYLERVIPEISHWDAERTRELMAPEALTKISEEKYQAIIKLFSKMGELQSMETPKFSETHPADIGNGEQNTLVEYKVDALYANGEAEITINLLPQDGHFQIYHFNLSSKTLLE